MSRVVFEALKVHDESDGLFHVGNLIVGNRIARERRSQLWSIDTRLDKNGLNVGSIGANNIPLRVITKHVDICDINFTLLCLLFNHFRRIIETSGRWLAILDVLELAVMDRVHHQLHGPDERHLAGHAWMMVFVCERNVRVREIQRDRLRVSRGAHRTPDCAVFAH